MKAKISPAITKVTGVRPSAYGGGDAERVVDRRADVAVGGREQRADAVDAAQRFVSGDSLGHLAAAGTSHSDRIYGRCRCPLHVGAAELGRARCSRSSARASSISARRSSSTRRAPRLAARREAPERRPADEHRVGAERQGDRDVGAAADAAVDQHRGAAGDRVDDLRQGVGGGRRAVELAAAVVGDDDAGGAVLDRERRVLGGQDALDQDRQRALGGERREVAPSRASGRSGSKISSIVTAPLEPPSRRRRWERRARPGSRSRCGGRARGCRRAARRR